MPKRSVQAFYREVQRLIVRYALLPMVLALVVGVALFLSIYYWSTLRQTQESLEIVSSRLERSVVPYSEAASAITITRDSLDGSHQPLAAALYDFMRQQSVRGEFYVFAGDGTLQVASRTALPVYLENAGHMNWGLFRRMQQTPESAVLLLNDAGSRTRPAMVLTIGQAFQDADGTYAYLIFELNQQEVYEFLNDHVQEDLVVTDLNHQTLLTSRNSYLGDYAKLRVELQDAAGRLQVDGTRFYVAQKTLPAMQLTVYALTSLDPVYDALLWTAVIFVLILIAAGFVLLMVARRMLAHETASVDALMVTLKRMQTDGLYPEIERTGNHHFSSVENVYYDLLAQIRELVEINKLEQTKRTTAEIRQLEAQFNPHFVFNTLELIRCLIKIDPQAANQMILDFSALLRYSISPEALHVPLADDLRELERYVSILRQKHEFTLNYTVRLAEGTANLLVPKLILQPVIENAAKYGGLTKSQLTLSVDARIEGGTLIIEVQNDGHPIPVERLTFLETLLQADTPPAEHSGLYNVHRRLQLMYGDGAGLSLRSDAQQGTTITLSMPLGETGDEHA